MRIVCTKGTSKTYNWDLCESVAARCGYRSFDIIQLLCRPSKLEWILPMMDYCDQGVSRFEHSQDARASAE